MGNQFKKVVEKVEIDCSEDFDTTESDSRPKPGSGS